MKMEVRKWGRSEEWEEIRRKGLGKRKGNKINGRKSSKGKDRLRRNGGKENKEEQKRWKAKEMREDGRNW